MNLNFLLNKPSQKSGPRDKYDESTNGPSVGHTSHKIFIMDSRQIV